MEAPPDDPAHRRSYLAGIGRLLDGVEPASINFGSLFAERSSAKRLMMLCAQMLKYVDGTTPIRFLIAECETSFTLLTALYFARLFGVADKLDISPLFETTKAFERGIKVIDDCLQQSALRRLCPRPRPALHPDRLLRRRPASRPDDGRGHRRAAAPAPDPACWSALGFADIELVIFDTHGESIGRGAHPSSFPDRLAYVASAMSRRHFADARPACEAGGELPGRRRLRAFPGRPRGAGHAVAGVLEFALTPPEEAAEDPLYEDWDYVTEFFITVRQFNERMMNDPNFAALLDAYGPNMLYPAGSRAQRRQHDGAAQHVDLSHPSQLRAIPHNAILQQLGLLANTLGGVGQAAAKDPDKFARFYRGFAPLPAASSPWWNGRWPSAIPMCCAAISTPSIPPHGEGKPLMSAERGPAAERRQVALFLERVDRHDRLTRILRLLEHDLLDLERELAGCRAAEPPAEPLIPDLGPEARANLRLLHAIKIALIQRIFRLATHIPEFSDQHGVTSEALIGNILHLDIEDSLRRLVLIFPKIDSAGAAGDFGESASYRSDANQSYEQEHARIFQPLAGLHELLRRASVGVYHSLGALG